MDELTSAHASWIISPLFTKRTPYTMQLISSQMALVVSPIIDCHLMTGNSSICGRLKPSC